MISLGRELIGCGLAVCWDEVVSLEELGYRIFFVGAANGLNSRRRDFLYRNSKVLQDGSIGKVGSYMGLEL